MAQNRERRRFFVRINHKLNYLLLFRRASAICCCCCFFICFFFFNHITWVIHTYTTSVKKSIFLKEICSVSMHTKCSMLGLLTFDMHLSLKFILSITNCVQQHKSIVTSLTPQYRHFGILHGANAVE